MPQAVPHHPDDLDAFADATQEAPARQQEGNKRRRIDITTYVPTPSDTHYDTKEVYDLPLPKRVANTRWNDSNNLSGRDLKELLAHEMIRGGIQAYPFRLLANGRFVRLEACKSVAEQQFVSTLLNARRRHECPLDLKELLRRTAVRFGTNPSTYSGQMQTWEKLAVELTDYLGEQSRKAAPESLNATIVELTRQIKGLNDENQRLRTGVAGMNPTSGSASSTNVAAAKAAATAAGPMPPANATAPAQPANAEPMAVFQPQAAVGHPAVFPGVVGYDGAIPNPPTVENQAMIPPIVVPPAVGPVMAKAGAPQPPEVEPKAAQPAVPQGVAAEALQAAGAAIPAAAAGAR